MHTRSTCPIPNCPACRRETFSDENKAAARAISGELKPQKPVRRWFDAKEVRPLLRLGEPLKVAAPGPVEAETPEPIHYCARKELYARWRSEPMDYAGRGVVYLFDTEAEAIAWSNHMNAEADKCK